MVKSINIIWKYVPTEFVILIEFEGWTRVLAHVKGNKNKNILINVPYRGYDLLIIKMISTEA
jgi:hypothetical protein